MVGVGEKEKEANIQLQGGADWKLPLQCGQRMKETRKRRTTSHPNISHININPKQMEE